MYPDYWIIFDKQSHKRSIFLYIPIGVLDVIPSMTYIAGRETVPNLDY